MNKKFDKKSFIEALKTVRLEEIQDIPDSFSLEILDSTGRYIWNNHQFYHNPF